MEGDFPIKLLQECQYTQLQTETSSHRTVPSIDRFLISTTRSNRLWSLPWAVFRVLPKGCACRKISSFLVVLLVESTFCNPLNGFSANLCSLDTSTKHFLSNALVIHPGNGGGIELKVSVYVLASRLNRVGTQRHPLPIDLVHFSVDTCRR